MPIINEQQKEEKTNIASNYYYSQLDEYGKIIYAGLYSNKENLKSGNYKIDFGTITDSLDSTEINVVYYYKLKEYIVKTNVINDGGTISGQGKDAYEIVKHGEDSKKKIEIVPYSGYKISKIKINEKEIEINANDAGIVVIDKLENIKENKNITVEFEKIKSKVIIKYLGKETNQEISEEQIKEGEVGEYLAQQKKKEEENAQPEKNDK